MQFQAIGVYEIGMGEPLDPYAIELRRIADALERLAASAAAAPGAPADRLISAKDLRRLVPLNRSTIYRLIRARRFPAPIQITRSRIAWRLSTILDWLAAREADAPPPPRKPKRAR